MAEYLHSLSRKFRALALCPTRVGEVSKTPVTASARCLRFFLAVALLPAGCLYETPLAEQTDAPVEPALLGTWEFVPPEEKSNEIERMLILAFSGTEYLVQYPVGGNDEAYYRAYAARVGDVPCVQLQLIGTPAGPPKDDPTLYHVAVCTLDGDELEIKFLNTDLVGTDLKTSDELRAKFLEHRNNPDLFTNAGKWRRATPPSTEKK